MHVHGVVTTVGTAAHMLAHACARQLSLMGKIAGVELVLLQGEGCAFHPALPVPLTIQVPL